MLQPVKAQLVRFQPRELDRVPDPQPVGSAELLPPVGQPSRLEIVSPGRYVLDGPALPSAVYQSHGEDSRERYGVIWHAGSVKRFFVFISFFLDVVVIVVVVDTRRCYVGSLDVVDVVDTRRGDVASLDVAVGVDTRRGDVSFLDVAVVVDTRGDVASLDLAVLLSSASICFFVPVPPSFSTKCSSKGHASRSLAFSRHGARKARVEREHVR